MAVSFGSTNTIVPGGATVDPFHPTITTMPVTPPPSTTPPTNVSTPNLKDLSIAAGPKASSPITPPTMATPNTPAQTSASQGTYTGSDGRQYNKYDNSPATPTPSLTSTTTSTGSPTTSTTADTLAQAQAEYQTHATAALDQITGLQNGSVPLTVGEQAQVDGLRSQFQQLIDQQQKANQSAQGIANIRGYQSGAAEYDPTFQVKTIGSIVSAGINKVADLQTKEASAIAQLTKSFRDDDIAAVKDAWNIYQQASKEKTDALQKTIDDTTKAVQQAQDNQMKEAQYNLDVQKFEQTKDKDAFDNAFKIEQEKFDEKYKNQSLAIEAFKAGYGAGGGGVPGGPTQSAQITATGNPDPASQQQVYDQMVQNYGPMTATAIKNLANYQTNPSDWSSRAAKGLTHAQAVTLAQMYDPTYDEKMYATRAAYQKSLASNQSGTVGSAVNAANKSINHLTAYVNTMSQVNKPGVFGTIGSAVAPGLAPYLGGRQSSTANTAMNAITIDPAQRANISKATTEGLGVAEELAKFFKGSGTVDVASIDAWKAQIGPNLSPAMVKGSTQGAIDLLTGQLEVLGEQYKSTMGKAATSDFLNESARASLSNLKNQGYTVDIPGVYYTDKDAYLKNDADAQDNMKNAVTALQNAGLPLTPENILQAAQAI